MSRADFNDWVALFTACGSAKWECSVDTSTHRYPRFTRWIRPMPIDMILFCCDPWPL